MTTIFRYFILPVFGVALFFALALSPAVDAQSSGVPDSPSSVTATSNTGYVNVSWPSVSDATHYSIERSVNGGAYSYLSSGFVSAYNQ